jgi:hypothetical protein
VVSGTPPRGAVDDTPTMVLAMYLEIKAPRSRRDASVYPYMAPQDAWSPYSTPRAETKAYNYSVPPLPTAQPLSSAIDGYIKWITCQGLEVPDVDFSSTEHDGWSDQVEQTPPKPRKKVPNGILHPPSILKPRYLGKKVRWRDNNKNERSAGCLPLVCVGESSLVDVYDDSPSGGRAIHRSATPFSHDDPILSFRERVLTTQPHHMDHYGPVQPLKRTPSPHPRAVQPAQTGTIPIAIRRSPSPHPSILHQQNPVAIPASDLRQQSRGRSASPIPLHLPRARTESPIPGRNRHSNAPHRVSQGTQPRSLPRPLRERSQSPAPAGSLARGPSPQRPSPQREQQQRTPQQQWTPPPRQVPLQNAKSQQRAATPQRSDFRQACHEPKRYAELPSRTEKRYAELPSREDMHEMNAMKEENYAEIVWKSKEKPLPREEKKRGWTLIRRSASLRKQQPQPEAPQFRRDVSYEDDARWITNPNSSINDIYGR